MDAPASLCPGYKQVETFGPDEEYEDEEEVCYVTLDMGNVEPTLVPSSTSYRLIGLDSPTPFLQLQGTILRGRHDLLLGTEMLFTDDKDNHDWNKRFVVHVANTEQRIAFREVTLIPKMSSSKGKERASTNDGEFVVNFEPPQENLSTQIDRMTGLSAPATRAPRTKKGSSTTKASKGKGKEEATSTTKSAKAKGKEKEKEVRPPLEETPMEEDAPGDDDMDDMYMDVE